MVVLNSSNRPKNIWLPKGMQLDKQLYKNQSIKIHLIGITNNAMSLFIEAKHCNICPLENFKEFKQYHIFFCQPASQQELT